ncbi:extracellular matrix regulator RemB [Caproicibacterium lactatifermentans]|uniref:extracellular matrix regulator RemB n=1 Tax=Caproicibacterium lactatifermentans TaxID=2666138 RepID=UPI003D91AC60
MIRSEDILGIFDMETSTISSSTRVYLANSEKAGHVVNVSMDMPKSFVLCCPPGGRETVYITPISSATLLRRASFEKELRNVNTDRQEPIK